MNNAFLKQPLVILIAAAIGVSIGLFNAQISNVFQIENFANIISFPGKLFVFFLQMTVIPIAVSAIASSLGKLMRSKASGELAGRLVFIFVIFMAALALGGMILGIIGRPGSGLNDETSASMGRLIPTSNFEVMLGSTEEANAAEQSQLEKYFISLIPQNIFMALSLGGILAIAFFSIIMGIAIGLLQEESALLLINFFSSVLYAFRKLFNLVMYLFPFALICICAGFVASFGMQLFFAMSKFIVLFGIGSLVVFIVCTIIIWLRSGIVNPLKILSALFEPVMLSFTTCNSMTALPSAINSLDTRMKFNSSAVNLALPLGMTIVRFENIFYFTLAVFFTAQLYGMALTPVHYIIIFFGVILAGTISAGAFGIVSISLLGIVLEPLNLPLEAVLIIFIAIDPIIAPVRSFLSVYLNIAVTTLIAKPEDDEAPSSVKEKQMIVYIQKINNKPPLLNRIEGDPDGIEILYIKEIGKRWNRQVVFKDAAAMNPQEREWMKDRADIIAGVITSDEASAYSDKFSLSQSWASVNINGQKTPLYFMLPAANREAEEINGIIRTLVQENYIKFILAAARAKES